MLACNLGSFGAGCQRDMQQESKYFEKDHLIYAMGILQCQLYGSFPGLGGNWG